MRCTNNQELLARLSLHLQEKLVALVVASVVLHWKGDCRIRFVASIRGQYQSTRLELYLLPTKPTYRENGLE